MVENCGKDYTLENGKFQLFDKEGKEIDDW